MKLDDKVKKTLKHMLIGMSIYELVLFIISLVFFIVYCYNKKVDNSFFFILKAEVGLVIGYLLGVLGMCNMAVTLSHAMDSRDEKYAKKYAMKYSIIRLLIFCAVLGIIINKNSFGLASGVMLALATLGVKIGTYLVPFIEKKF